MRTVRKNPDKEIDCTNLVINVMGYNHTNPAISAFKYGRLQELVAKQAFSDEDIQDVVEVFKLTESCVFKQWFLMKTSKMW